MDETPPPSNSNQVSPERAEWLREQAKISPDTMPVFRGLVCRGMEGDCCGRCERCIFYGWDNPVLEGRPERKPRTDAEYGSLLNQREEFFNGLEREAAKDGPLALEAAQLVRTFYTAIHSLSFEPVYLGEAHTVYHGSLKFLREGELAKLTDRLATEMQNAKVLGVAYPWERKGDPVLTRYTEITKNKLI